MGIKGSIIQVETSVFFGPLEVKDVDKKIHPTVVRSTEAYNLEYKVRSCLSLR